MNSSNAIFSTPLATDSSAFSRLRVLFLLPDFGLIRGSFQSSQLWPLFELGPSINCVTFVLQYAWKIALSFALSLLVIQDWGLSGG